MGHALKTIPREKYYIATKVGELTFFPAKVKSISMATSKYNHFQFQVGRYDPATENTFDFSVEKTVESFHKSLELLQVDYVDLIQVKESIITDG